METMLFYSSIYLVCLMAFSMYRTAVGPTTLDRLVGMNAIGAKTVVAILFIGLIFNRLDMFIDIALSYAMLNFIAVLAACRYLHKRGRLYPESHPGEERT